MKTIPALSRVLPPLHHESTYRVAGLGVGLAALGAALFFLGCQQRALPTEGIDEPTATELTLNVGDPAVIGLGSSAQLQATPRDSRGQPVPGYTITWESADSTVVKVDEDGYITALALGSADVTAKAEKKGNRGKGKDTAPGQLKKQNKIIVDPVPVASVEVLPSEGTVATGGTMTFSAITRDADGNELTNRIVSWSSSATAVVTVDETGTVDGVSVGTAAITATSEEQSGSAGVTVTELAVVDVAVWPQAPNVEPGQMVQFYAAFLLSDGSVVCEPGNPSTDPAVLYNANVVDGCAEATALVLAE